MIHQALRLVGVFAGILVLSATSACTQKPGTSDSAAKDRVVNLAIWSNYVSPELITEFQKRTGIRVAVANYSSNEELLAKLQAGASGYDVAVPSDYMVFAMSKLGLLHELDYAQLPNMKSLDRRYLGKNFDPGNKVSVPYDWGTTGIAVNRELYKGEIKSWKDLFTNPALVGKISVLDDMREVMGAALKCLGYSLNTKNPEELKKAKELLIRARKNIKAFTSEPLMSLVNGETLVAHAYSGDAMQSGSKTNGKVQYIIPSEGVTLWIDNLVIPASAQHVNEAHAFINFLLEPASDVSTVEHIFVSPANKDAIPLLPKALQTSTALFPPPEVMARTEMMQDLGEALSMWDRIWTEIKASTDN